MSTDRLLITYPDTIWPAGSTANIYKPPIDTMATRPRWGLDNDLNVASSTKRMIGENLRPSANRYHSLCRRGRTLLEGAFT